MNADVKAKVYSLIDELGRLLGGAAIPCADLKDGKSCFHRIGDERHKKTGGLVLWYDTDCPAARRLCQPCQAYWHVMVARNNVDRQVRTDEEKAREAQHGNPA